MRQTIRREFIQAAIAGFFCANVATFLGGLLYGRTALHEDLTAQSFRLFGYVVLSSEFTLLLAGAGAGMLSWALLHRLGATGGTLVATMLATIFGGLVGYRYTWGAPHVFPQHAILDLAAAWGITALAALSATVWFGGGERRFHDRR